MPGTIKRVQAASIDGRARTPRFIQNQLRELHDSLVNNAQEIRSAIHHDTGHSAVEADIEYCLALDCVKEQYSSIQFDKAVEEEYSLARGKDYASRRVAAGIVYIAPSNFTLFYSVVAPLSAAIAAGNCVVLQLGKTTSELNALLRTQLTEALDSDTFALIESTPTDESFLNSCIQVFGSQTEQQPSLTKLISPSTSRTVAVVDRSADIDEAAKSIVQARFSFNGASPYAPDLVLVNEFRITDFSNAVVRESTKYFAQQITMNGNGSVSKHPINAVKGLTEEERREEGTSVVVSGSKGSIVHVKTRESALLQRKITEPMLIIHTISSLDDAIDLANAQSTPLLASYLFAHPTSAKYLAQFIDVSISYTNHIPTHLLIGPAAPSSSISPRYPKSLFEVARPQYIHPSPLSTTLRQVLEKQQAKELVYAALKPLPETKQRPGKAIGFFEQGLLTGALVILLPVLTGGLALGAYGMVSAVRRWR